MWDYADWASQETDAARESRLRLHISEVSGRVSADVSHAGGSRSSGPLVQYLEGLRADLRRYEARNRRAPRGLRVRRG
ncbi:MAG: hypothetical protein AAGI53_09545 [Planctomycetota bacterium]